MTAQEIIEKIRAELERLLNDRSIPHTGKWYEGYLTALRKMNSSISDLEKEEKPMNLAVQEQPVKTNIVEDLKHYLATTPKEQIEKDWESLKEWDKIGPSVSEFLGWKQPVCEGLEDILLEFYDEYDSNVENRPIIPRIYAEKLSRHFAKWGAEHAKECEEKPNKVKADFDIYRFQQKFCIHCEIPHCTGTIDYLKSCPYLNK